MKPDCTGCRREPWWFAIHEDGGAHFTEKFCPSCLLKDMGIPRLGYRDMVALHVRRDR
jgi:hypothetical protein